MQHSVVPALGILLAALSLSPARGAGPAASPARSGQKPQWAEATTATRFAVATPDAGVAVGALAAVNSVGSVLMPGSDVFWAWPFEIDGEFGGRIPDPSARAVEPVPDDSKLAALGRFAAGANTTLAVVATTAALTTAEATRLAMMAQDGLARAIRPAHTPFDGDVVFALSSGAVGIGEGSARSLTIARLGSAAADTLARAIARGAFEAA